jgi:hypothetical protein
MAHMPPGGLIPSGIGGCLCVGDLGTDLTTPDWTEAQCSISNGLLDVGRWFLEELFITAECPHSGCWGAIARRRVAYDFRFNLEIPYDYNNPPDEMLAGAASVGIRFNLADVTQEPLLAANNAEQRFYVAPSAFMERAVPVLDARGDVIRMNVTGLGNGIIFLFPDDQANYKAYIQYMQKRGWLT